MPNRNQNDGHPLARPTELASLVATQPGSVVSRPVHKTANGSLTLFAFDAGQGLSEHSTPHDAFVELLEGSMEISVGGEVHVVREGQALMLPGGVPHALAAKNSVKLLLTMLRLPATEP